MHLFCMKSHASQMFLLRLKTCVISCFSSRVSVCAQICQSTQFCNHDFNMNSYIPHFIYTRQTLHFCVFVKHLRQSWYFNEKYSRPLLNKKPELWKNNLYAYEYLWTNMSNIFLWEVKNESLDIFTNNKKSYLNANLNHMGANNGLHIFSQPFQRLQNNRAKTIRAWGELLSKPMTQDRPNQNQKPKEKQLFRASRGNVVNRHP